MKEGTYEKLMLERLKNKPDDMGITEFLKAFAGMHKIKPGQAHTIYYTNGVRTEYEKYKQRQDYWKGKEKPAPKEPGRPLKENTINLKELAKEMEQDAKEAAFVAAEKTAPETKETMLEPAMHKAQIFHEHVEVNVKQPEETKKEVQPMAPTDTTTPDQINRLRIAFLEQKLKTVKDPFQRIILKPWLEEMKGAAANETD